jgi:hypothetical protein
MREQRPWFSEMPISYLDPGLIQRSDARSSKTGRTEFRLASRTPPLRRPSRQNSSSVAQLPYSACDPTGEDTGGLLASLRVSSVTKTVPGSPISWRLEQQCSDFLKNVRLFDGTVYPKAMSQMRQCERIYLTTLVGGNLPFGASLPAHRFAAGNGSPTMWLGETYKVRLSAGYTALANVGLCCCRTEGIAAICDVAAQTIFRELHR